MVHGMAPACNVAAISREHHNPVRGEDVDKSKPFSFNPHLLEVALVVALGHIEGGDGQFYGLLCVGELTFLCYA